MIINFIKFMRKNVFIAVGVICSIALGFFIGLNVKNKIEMFDKNDDFKAGWMAARQKLIDSGYVNTDKNSLSGVIKEIGENKIIFTAELVNPLDDESIKTRTALITENTEIILRTQAEEKQIDLNVLEENYNIWVESAENIADKSEFTAIRIIADKNNTLNDFDQDMNPKISVDDDEDKSNNILQNCSLDDNEINKDAKTHSISVPSE